MREVYVVSAARTAVGKSKRTLANFRPEDMGAAVLKEVVARAGVPPEAVEDVTIGCAFPEGEQGMNMGRLIVLRAGLPDTVPAMTVNRFCSSGLESIAILASKIRAGLLHAGVAGGVETMSLIPMGGGKFSPNPWLAEQRPEAYMSMGNCGDNVARDFGITREQMDAWALGSVKKALAAIDAGKFKSQIVPLEVPTADGGTIVFDTDEGPRRDTTIEGLAKLKPAFAATGGFCTPGNSSQTSDGAAAVMLMSEHAMQQYGVKPLAKFRGYSVKADSPIYLGPAQIDAIKRACKLSGIDIADVGLIENNEAFASQCLYVNRTLGLEPDRVNVNGGAIALGHPLGCTGSKLTTQLVYEMHVRRERFGLVTMCIGGGMGAAGVFELCE